MRKPQINLRCVANNYAASGERIAEFTDPNDAGGGGLISIRHTDEGTVVEVYGLDPQVDVRVGKRRV